jgi:hypothetical protein
MSTPAPIASSAPPCPLDGACKRPTSVRPRPGAAAPPRRRGASARPADAVKLLRLAPHRARRLPGLGQGASARGDHRMESRSREPQHASPDVLLARGARGRASCGGRRTRIRRNLERQAASHRDGVPDAGFVRVERQRSRRALAAPSRRAAAPRIAQAASNRCASRGGSVCRSALGAATRSARAPATSIANTGVASWKTLYHTSTERRETSLTSP